MGVIFTVTINYLIVVESVWPPTPRITGWQCSAAKSPVRVDAVVRHFLSQFLLNARKDLVLHRSI